MTKHNLDATLFQLTPAEIQHKSNTKDSLSNRYLNIPKIHYQNRDVYLFSFNKLLENKQICIHKESRFTYIPEHIHTVIELIYVYSGNCTQIIDGKRVPMSKGDICLLDTNVPHQIEYLNEKDIIITINMRKEYLTQGFLLRLGDYGIVNHFLIKALSSDANHDEYLLFKNKHSNNIHEIIQKLFIEYHEREIFSEKMIDAYMILLFCELLRLYKNEQFPQLEQQGDLIIKILNYIEDNYLSVSLQSVAKHFGFHPNYLSNYIKKFSGKTFKELVIQQKMNVACFELSNSNLPIYEIANNLGYNNLGFFYKKFEEIYQMSPASYRRIHQSEV